MREQVIEDLRDRASVRGKQKTWISELSDDQLYELFLKLRNQETAKSIARHIQQAWGVNPHSSSFSIPRDPQVQAAHSSPPPGSSVSQQHESHSKWA